MDNEDKITLNKKEQMDILTDPFALEIISAMDPDHIETKEWIAEEVNEKLSLVSKYVDRMVENGFMVIDDEKSNDNRTYYKMAARSIQSSKDLIFSNEMKEFWISGFINYLENSMVDFFNYMSKVEKDKREHLKDKGYHDDILSDFSTIYLSKEEVEEIHNFLKQYILEKADKKREKNEEFKPYYSFSFLFPKLKDKKQ
mgnify:CR=1 FL=1